jgi:hypothetical protein
MRSHGSSSNVLIFDGLAPSVFLLSFSSFEVFGYGKKTKGSYSNVGMTFSN